MIDLEDAENHEIITGFKPKFVCVVNEFAINSSSNNISYAIVSVYMEDFSDNIIWQSLKYASNSYHQLIEMDTTNKGGQLPILRGMLDNGFNISLEALTRTISYISRFYGNYYWYASA